jgi:hypothetical protein
MKTLKLLIIILLINLNYISGYSQGTNNDFEYDKEDLNVIAKELGIQAFKFPIEQKKDELIDIIIEQYENKKLIKKLSIIDEYKKAFEKYGIDGVKYFKPDGNFESPFFHRFYFIKRDSIMEIKIKTHGVEKTIKFNFENLSLYDTRAHNSTMFEIDSLGYLKLNNSKNKKLMFLYANSKNEQNKPLNCPSGLPKENIVDLFYYAIFIELKKYETEE